MTSYYIFGKSCPRKSTVLRFLSYKSMQFEDTGCFLEIAPLQVCYQLRGVMSNEVEGFK